MEIRTEVQGKKITATRSLMGYWVMRYGDMIVKTPHRDYQEALAWVLSIRKLEVKHE